MSFTFPFSSTTAAQEFVVPRSMPMMGALVMMRIPAVGRIVPLLGRSAREALSETRQVEQGIATQGGETVQVIPGWELEGGHGGLRRGIERGVGRRAAGRQRELEATEHRLRRCVDERALLGPHHGQA